LLILGIARLAWLLPPQATWFGFVISTGLSAGALWAIAPWTPILGLTFFGSSAIVGVVAWRGRVLPGWLAAALIAGLMLPLVLVVAMLVLPWYVLREAGISSIVFFIGLFLVWPLVALCLLRARRQDLHTTTVVPA
jgi:hypothetical protein